MLVLQVVAVVAGGALVVFTLLAALKTVVVPRDVSSIVTRFVFVNVRRVFAAVVPKRADLRRKDGLLALYAPIALILLPGVWVAMLIAGFTLVFWGTGFGSWQSSFEEAGSSILTLGFSKPTELLHIVLAFVAATLGLGVVALLISYLPSIYGAFNRREQLDGMLDGRAGTPPSAAELLTRYQRIGWLDHVDDLFGQWEMWFSDVEESHTSLPALVFFRSPVPERSWITAAGCVLDTAAIVHSTLELPQRTAQGAMMIRTGFFCLRHIADYFGIEHDRNPGPTDPISVSRREFDLLCVELQAVGIPLRADRDQAWRDFAGWRVNYDTVLVQLAALVQAPPGRWSSDRGGARPKPKVLRRTG